MGADAPAAAEDPEPEPILGPPSEESTAGTAPIAEGGGTAGVGDMAAQMRRCLEISLKALADAGARPEDVIRSRIIVTDITRWEEAARVHGEVFGEIRPACTVMAVSGFVDPEWLVETELDAIIPEASQ